MERPEAQEFRRLHVRSTFWCGFLLGGCGGQLSPKIYRDRVSHFAHHASGNSCTRRHGGLESADHLYASKQANLWLGSLGRPLREPHFTGDFASGGTCQRVVLPATDEYPAILFEFSTDFTEELNHFFARMRDKSPSWLVRENVELTHRLLHENSFALRFRMRTENLERVLEVGTVGLSGSIHWEPIGSCALTSQGIVTPRMEELVKARQQQATAKKVPRQDTPRRKAQPKPHRLITSLQFSLEQHDRANIQHLTHQLRLSLRTSQDPSITGFRDKAEALLAWSARLLEHGKKPTAGELPPLYRPTSTSKATTPSKKTGRTTRDRGGAGRSTPPQQKGRTHKVAPQEPLEKRTLNTLISDATKAYKSGNQGELRRIRAVLRKRKGSASRGDQHRIDWVLESCPASSTPGAPPGSAASRPITSTTTGGPESPTSRKGAGCSHP
jgi:hypothetical protein